jgi:hypothetical protein
MKILRTMGLLACALFAANANADMLFAGTMAGANEIPANASTATGFTSISINDSLSLMTVHVDWSGLTGGLPSAAHIHCCTAQGTNIGVAVGFPSFTSTLSGSYDHVFDLLSASTYTTAFLNNFGGGTAAGARDALIFGLNAGTAYSNIHNATFPGGEIRANLSPVPLPAAAWLLLSGLGALGAKRTRRILRS